MPKRQSRPNVVRLFPARARGMRPGASREGQAPQSPGGQAAAPEESAGHAAATGEPDRAGPATHIETAAQGPANTKTPDPAPAWADHPITRALEAFYQDPAIPNPAEIIARGAGLELPQNTPHKAPPAPSQPPPGGETPFAEAPLDEGAFAEAPLQEAPLQEAPLEEAPLGEAPFVDAPVREEAPQEQAEADSDAEFWRVWLGHQDQLRNQCLRMMSGNQADAEDALSNAMLRASQKFARYAGSINNERAWLSKLVHNVCIDHFRREKRTQCFAIDQEPEAHVSEAMFTEPARSPEELLLCQEQLMELEKCMGKLSQNLRGPLVMRCVEGRSYADIAEELDLRADTVRKRIQLARDFLRGSNIR